MITTGAHTGFFNGRGTTSRLGSKAAMGPKLYPLPKTENSSDLAQYFWVGPPFLIIYLPIIYFILFSTFYHAWGARARLPPPPLVCAFGPPQVILRVQCQEERYNKNQFGSYLH